MVGREKGRREVINRTGMTHIENLTDRTLVLGDWLELGARSTVWAVVMLEDRKKILRQHAADGDLRVVFPGEDDGSGEP
jgi:hypothetical protein